MVVLEVRITTVSSCRSGDAEQMTHEQKKKAADELDERR